MESEETGRVSERQRDTDDPIMLPGELFMGLRTSDEKEAQL